MKYPMTSLTIEQSFQTGEVKPLLTGGQNVDDTYITDVATTKRFLERWSADPQFREDIQDDPYGVTRQYNLQADPEEIRLLWDVKGREVRGSQASIPLKVRRYEAFFCEKINHLNSMLSKASPTNSYFRAWRERQISRTLSEMGAVRAQVLAHAPFSIELSRGCSVGCWFCGVAAPRLSDIFRYTRENRQLWRDVLEVMREVIGPAAGYGFCYWASDPLDNPEYEQFLIDFHAVLGRLPQTTTALPMRNPARTRDLLKLSAEKGYEIERFSLLTLRMLDQVHQEFSAEELLSVDLVCHNDGARTPKVVAGRAREERFRKRLEANNHSWGAGIAGTIACVSGFLLNMVDGRVRLISPCNASDRWPLGYRTYAEAGFKSASELRTVLEDMIKTHMPLTLDLNKQVSFLDDEPLPDLSSQGIAREAAETQESKGDTYV